MEKYEIKSFLLADIKDVIEVWNESLPYDVINEERFTKLVLLDENFDNDLFKVAYVNDKVVGFIYGIHRKFPYLERGLEPERGYVSIMGVNPDWQRKGIGSTLLNQLEEKFVSMGVKEITLCAYSPNYFFPGIDLRYTEALSFVEEHQYILTSNAVSMQRNLFDYRFTKEMKDRQAELNASGIVVKAYESRYMQLLLDFLLDQFGSGWKRNAFLAMQHGEAEETILLAVDKNDQILGFCMRKIDGNEGRFGPFGVNESLRSKGIGGILFENMMLDMKKRGVTNTYFLWSGGDAQRFYERHHLQVYRTYQLYRKKVSK